MFGYFDKSSVRCEIKESEKEITDKIKKCKDPQNKISMSFHVGLDWFMLVSSSQASLVYFIYLFFFTNKLPYKDVHSYLCSYSSV